MLAPMPLRLLETRLAPRILVAIVAFALIATALSISPAPAQAAGGTYYVAGQGRDLNAGSATSPWRTLQHAVSAAPSGSTVLIRGGRYAGFDTNRSGLTLKAYPGESVIVEDSSRNNVVWLRGVQDWVLADLTVTGAPDQWGAGVRIDSGSSRVGLHRLTVTKNRSFGVKVAQSSQVEILNSTISWNETGIEVSGAGQGVLIHGNTIHNNDRMVVNTPEPGGDRGANAIVFHKTVGPIRVTSNTIYGNRATHSYDYGMDGGAFEIYGASNIAIEANRLWDNQNIMETGTDNSAPCNNIRFLRNVAYGASTTGPSQGLILRCASNSLIAHNTLDSLDSYYFYVTGSSSDGFGGPIDGLRIVNNISQSDRAKIYSLGDAIPGSVKINHNLSWMVSGGSIAWVAGKGNTSSFSTLRTWTGYESAGINASPAFVSAALRDYKFKAGSPAQDRGLDIGLPFSGSAPDLGFWEANRVTRLAGSDRYSTAATVSRATFPTGVPVAYVATGANYPDALAGGAAAAVHGAPILLTTRTSVPSATAAELTRLRSARIVILGGTGAISDGVAATLASYTTGNVSRHAGPDRYATAAAISRATFGVGTSVAYVATGANYPDALAAIPLAKRTNSPLLLTNRSELPAVTANELRRLAPGRIVILGGTGVVTDSVRTALTRLTTGTVERIAGVDRYATAAAIAAKFPAGVSAAYLATGMGFADALAGGPAAAFGGTPLLLVTRDRLPTSTAAQLDRLKPAGLRVLGGLGAVTDHVVVAAAKYVR